MEFNEKRLQMIDSEIKEKISKEEMRAVLNILISRSSINIYKDTVVLFNNFFAISNENKKRLIMFYNFLLYEEVFSIKEFFNWVQGKDEVTVFDCLMKLCEIELFLAESTTSDLFSMTASANKVYVRDYCREVFIGNIANIKFPYKDFKNLLNEVNSIETSNILKLFLNNNVLFQFRINGRDEIITDDVNFVNCFNSLKGSAISNISNAVNYKTDSLEPTNIAKYILSLKDNIEYKAVIEKFYPFFNNTDESMNTISKELKDFMTKCISRTNNYTLS